MAVTWESVLADVFTEFNLESISKGYIEKVISIVSEDIR